MRIVSYNILLGGTGRADPLAEVILAQQPDIIGLVEATDIDMLYRIARRCRMDFIQAMSGHHGVALLSRWPIEQSINHAAIVPGNPLTRNFLEVHIRPPTGQKIIACVIHLHAHARLADEDRRLEEIPFILDTLAPHRAAGRPHVLMGDFNANSPEQVIDIARCKPSTQEEYALNGQELPRELIRRVLATGYTDTLHATDPEISRNAGSFSTQYPGQRVDYIFTHGIDASAINNAWIETDRLAQFASDHYPIGAQVRWPGEPSPAENDRNYAVISVSPTGRRLSDPSTKSSNAPHPLAPGNAAHSSGSNR